MIQTNMMLKTMEMKSIEPKLTQKLIGKQIGFTVSTIKRLKQFWEVDSHYNKSKYEKKKNKLIASITQTYSQTTNGNTTQKNTKNYKNYGLSAGCLLED